MLKMLFDIGEDETVQDFHFSIQQDYWAIAWLCFFGLLFYAVYLYRSESWLSHNRRLIMGGSYVLAGLLLVFLLLQPTLQMEYTTPPPKRKLLVLVDASHSMSIHDKFQREEDLLEVAKIMQIEASDSTQGGNEAKLDLIKKKIAENDPSRLDLVKAAIGHPSIGFSKTAGDQYEVIYYTLGESLTQVADGSEETELLDGQTADANSSRIGSAIEEALNRHAGQPLAGIVVMSDFAWIGGTNPSKAARKAKQQGVPIYPVTFGLPSPPDVRLKRIIAPEVAFVEDDVPIRVQVDSSGFEGEEVEVTLQGDGVEIKPMTKRLDLTGGSQFVEFTLKATKDGTKNLTAEVETLVDETTGANNVNSHNLRIIDEKIKVLYVEGMPRWEYRYLRWVLKRDPRLQVHFLMTYGDTHLARTSPEHLGAFPSQKQDIFKYDLIILGDVPSSYFNDEKMSNLEELVKESGGSLLMLAGPMGSPTSYAKTKIADMLPVKIGGGRWRGKPSVVHPVTTPEGLKSEVVFLANDPNKGNLNNLIWTMVRPLGYLPVLDGSKPGATTLLTLSDNDEDAEAYPLVAWQRYGSGKTMYVGTADLWRLRRQVGEQYHARFWRQTIQFLALSRILGQNKQITLETGREQYATGERIDLFANVLTEEFKPVDNNTSYSVTLTKEGANALPLTIDLAPVDKTHQPGLYSGSYLAVEEGSFVLSVPESNFKTPKANKVEFVVENKPIEQRETAMNEEVANQIAIQSGGQNLAGAQLGTLPDLLPPDVETKPLVKIREKALWDVPLIFLILVIITGVEWYMRRRENLV